MSANSSPVTEPRRILSIDGGGIRCMIAVEILLSLEEKIREVTNDPTRKLCDQFDMIAGTSGGAIVASAVAMGTPMEEVRDFVLNNAKYMCKSARWYERWRSRYDDAALSAHMRKLYGADTTLGSDKLKSLLLLVLRNWTTESPWLVSNNPQAKYNQPELDDCNLNLPLWQLARASAAAPYYYEPETIRFGNKNQYEFVFVDGALTGFLNPAFKAFQYVTNGAYGLNWPASENDLVVVSVGAGDIRKQRLDKTARHYNIFRSALDVPDALMYATTREQDLLCRTLGRCITGATIDSEVDDMKAHSYPVEPRLFRYHRINPSLSESGLKKIGCAHITAENLFPVDSVKYVNELAQVGQGMSYLMDDVVVDCVGEHEA